MVKKNILGIATFLERLAAFVTNLRKKEEKIEHKVEKPHYRGKANGDIDPANAAAQNQINKKILVESGQDVPEWLVRRNVATEQIRAANPNITQKDLDKILNKEPTFNAPKQPWSTTKTGLVAAGALSTAFIGVGVVAPTLEGKWAADESFGYKPGDAPFTMNISHPLIDSIEALGWGENAASSLPTDRYANSLAANSKEGKGRENINTAINNTAHNGLIESLKKSPIAQGGASRAMAEAKAAEAAADARTARAEATKNMVDVYKDRMKAHDLSSGPL